MHSNCMKPAPFQGLCESASMQAQTFRAVLRSARSMTVPLKSKLPCWQIDSDPRFLLSWVIACTYHIGAAGSIGKSICQVVPEAEATSVASLLTDNKVGKVQRETREEDNIMVKALSWDSGDWHSVLSSAVGSSCDPGKVLLL